MAYAVMADILMAYVSGANVTEVSAPQRHPSEHVCREVYREVYRQVYRHVCRQVSRQVYIPIAALLDLTASPPVTTESSPVSA